LNFIYPDSLIASYFFVHNLKSTMKKSRAAAVSSTAPAGDEPSEENDEISEEEALERLREVINQEISCAAENRGLVRRPGIPILKSKRMRLLAPTSHDEWEANALRNEILELRLSSRCCSQAVLEAEWDLM